MMGDTAKIPYTRCEYNPPPIRFFRAEANRSGKTFGGLPRPNGKLVSEQRFVTSD
jgi:hypothetical protein